MSSSSSSGGRDPDASETHAPRRHRLLERQLRAVTRDREDGSVDLEMLLELVSQAYTDQELNERHNNEAIELVSREVAELNRQLREEAAARSREAARTSALLENASEAIVSANGLGQIVSFNSAAERMFGWSRDEAIGQETSILFADWPTAHKALTEAMAAQPAAATRLELEIPARRKNGQEFAREFSLSILEFEGEQIRIGFHRDISGRKAAQAALLAAKNEAEQANTAKSEFLAAMSHEIRTPLNGVLGMAAAMESTPLTEEQCGMLSVINESGQILMTLLSDILDLSKIEAGRMVFESAVFDVAASAQAVARLYSETAGSKGLGYEVEIEESARGWFVGDPTRYRQILQNLVSNALKFTERGEVRIKVDALPGMDGEVLLRTTVQDTGVGISSQVKNRLFRKFSQADASITRRYGGTGLGLSICRQLVDALGGQIGVDSEAGKGSSFWFLLPFSRAEARVEPQAVVSEETGARGSKLRILAAEDNKTNQLVLKALLAQADVEVTFVDNGVEAVDAASNEDFDLILMDVQMPVMDGMTAARNIRGLKGSRAAVPIIAVTADAMPEQVRLCLAAGMDAHVSKPLRPEALFSVIEDALSHPRQPLRATA